MKLLFVGHFSPASKKADPASSFAGNFVQKKIVDSLGELENAEVRSIALSSVSSWPKGPFYLKGIKEENFYFPGFINIKLLKELSFCFSLICCMLKYRPREVYQYNTYLFTNLVVLVLSRMVGYKKCVIIQDLRVGDKFTRLARLHDNISAVFLKYYDALIPVTIALAKKIGVCENRTFVFPGGVEADAPVKRPSQKKSGGYESNNKKIAIFAGALEPYNGADKLINFWLTYRPMCELHIFGRGSLRNLAEEAAIGCPNIVYHGGVSKGDVSKWMEVSDFNFCLRFSDGIDQNYFFPSKFFSVNTYPGFAMTNKFCNIPEDYANIGYLVKDDLSNIVSLIELDVDALRNITEERQSIIFERYNWGGVLNKVHGMFLSG